MTEWGVVGVIVTLIGLGAAVVAPIIKLNTTITRLSTIVDKLGEDIAGFAGKNAKAHERMWVELDDHKESLHDHETRITVLEHDTKGG